MFAITALIKRFSGILLLALILILQSCQSGTTLTPLKVEWKLEKNVEWQNTPAHETIFTLTNVSTTNLSDNWALYWNQAPRVILEIDSTTNISLRNINGDFYEMKALPGFSLGPNQSVTVKVVAEEWMVKEADAPVGLYQVVQNKGKETIGIVQDYTIAKFETDEQLTRSKSDAEPIPTPQYLFEENKKVTLLDEEELYPFVPAPARTKKLEGKFVFKNGLPIVATKELEKETDFFRTQLKELYQINTNLQNEATTIPAIHLTLDARLEKAESYTLEVKEDGINIAGKDPAGVFYGVQSLLALLKQEDDETFAPAYEITDSPAYPYRGFHIDVGRNFQSKETILRVLDILARYKINKLLLYLTEDEGWRLDIEELPELAQVSGRRGHTLNDSLNLQPGYGSGPFADDPDSFGNGFYTREDFKEIIRYAHDRHIEVIPSLNLPAHARSAIKAMEYRFHRLMKEGKEEEAIKYRLIDPNDVSKYRSAQFYTDNVVCVCRDQSYDFYEVVLDDIIEMYAEAEVPLHMMHTGGDEVPAGSWEGSPICEAYLKAYPEIKNFRNLQTHFFDRLTKMIAAKGLKIGGWEEVVMEFDEDGQWVINSSFTDRQVYPYIWNNLWGQQDLGYRIANRGYPVILCPVTNFYFDLAYDKDPREPGLYWAGFNDTKDAFACIPEDLFRSTTEDDMGRKYNPEVDFEDMERLTPEGRKNIAGLQSQLWSETVRGRNMLEYYILPKILGFAQRAWQGGPSWAHEADGTKRAAALDTDWNQFVNTLSQKEFPKLDKLNGGYHYRIPAPGILFENDTVHINTSYPGLEIRYTTDGSEPNANSPIYEGPFLSDSKEIVAKCFNQQGRSGFSSNFTKELLK